MLIGTRYMRSLNMNFLIDKEGIIIAKNLRGEDLAKTLNNMVKQEKVE